MGNLFVAVVEELQKALTIFVILKSFNTTKIKEDPAY
jgi:RsiW-degrading membrane proteinase PrsW (M82 family)